MSYASTFFRKADLTRLSKRFPTLDWRGDSNDEKPAEESGAFGANIVERNSQQREFAARVLEAYLLEQDYNIARARYETAVEALLEKFPEARHVDLEPDVRPHAEKLRQIENRLGELAVN